MSDDTLRLRMEIRPANLRRLIEDMFDGNTGAFADKIGRPRSNIYGILRKTEGDRRGIGEALARDIERILKLDHGELDRPPGAYVNADTRRLDDIERALITKFRQLTPANRNVIRALLESLPVADESASSTQPNGTPSSHPRRRFS